MEKAYDKEGSVALIREAKEIVAGLKAEVVNIETQMGLILDGREEDADTAAPSVSRE